MGPLSRGHQFNYLALAHRTTTYKCTLSLLPCSITYILIQLGENHSLQKADEWRRYAAIQHVVLWLCWRDEDDEIPTTAPPIPSRSTVPEGVDRHLHKFYRLALLISSACRVLAARAISMTDVHHGQELLRSYCLLALTMGIHLMPNHHLSMHYWMIFKLFGPAYAWWLFGFERFNGLLEKVKLNGHANGEMETTLMRNWVRRHRVYDLVRRSDISQVIIFVAAYHTA